MELVKQPIKTILLIDDDTDDCTVFETALEIISSTIGFACVNAGENVLDAVAMHQPDLIFLDINMPRIDGFSCLKQLQEHRSYARIPIIMYSSSQSPKEINAAYGYGASLYFRKPTRYADLLDALQSILLLDWNQPDVIKGQYFKEGQYCSFAIK